MKWKKTNIGFQRGWLLAILELERDMAPQAGLGLIAGEARQLSRRRSVGTLETWNLKAEESYLNRCTLENLCRQNKIGILSADAADSISGVQDSTCIC